MDSIIHQHDYLVADSWYYKVGSDGGYDQSVSYGTLYCRGCGERKEIIWRDCRMPTPELREKAGNP